MARAARFRPHPRTYFRGTQGGVRNSQAAAALSWVMGTEQPDGPGLGERHGSPTECQSSALRLQEQHRPIIAAQLIICVLVKASGFLPGEEPHQAKQLRGAPLHAAATSTAHRPIGP
jgi:hypothetical protein